MWSARYFPGLTAIVGPLGELTPEATATLHRAGQKLLDGEAELKLAHTKAIMRASGARLA
jgi:hypothetical protein